MIDYLANQGRVVNPDEFFEGLSSGAGGANDVVLTFDDALLSQFDVALPVLENSGIKAVFNVYSSVFTGQPDPLELFAIFRAQEFNDFEEFWSFFIEHLEQWRPETITDLEVSYPHGWLAAFPFYTENERKFRYLRDKVLGKAAYEEIMYSLMAVRPRFNLESAARGAWMTKQHLEILVEQGHTIGLHSHSHPTVMAELSFDDQQREYQLNRDWICEELGISPTVVAHPCGSYGAETLEILREMKVEFGFRSSMTQGPFGTSLEIPRVDHANLLQEIR